MTKLYTWRTKPLFDDHRFKSDPFRVGTLSKHAEQKLSLKAGLFSYRDGLQSSQIPTSEEEMEQSTTYVALEAMIRRHWLWMTCSQFRRLLDKLEKQGQITAEEHKVLLDLADEIRPCLRHRCK